MDIKKNINESPSAPLIQNIGSILNDIYCILKHIISEDKAYISITLNSHGYSSRCFSVPLDFSDFTNDIDVCYVSNINYASKVVDYSDYPSSIIPAGEGVFLYNKTSGPITVNVPIALTFAKKVSGNMLTGLTEDFTIETGKTVPIGYTVYALTSTSGGVSKVKEGQTISAGKAILIIPTIPGT